MIFNLYEAVGSSIEIFSLIWVERFTDLIISFFKVDIKKFHYDDAKADGRFVLSTGDQCGRDTPEENILAMIETAKNYGEY